MSQSYSSSVGRLSETGGIAATQATSTISAANTGTGCIASVTTGAKRFTLTGVSITITLATTVAATVLTVERRKEPLVTGTALGSFSVPVAVAGSVITCNEITGDIQPGESVVVTTDGGCSAGAGIVVIDGYQSPVLATTAGTDKEDSGTGKVYLVAKD